MKYRAYTQKDWNAEKIYIEEDQNTLTLEADNEEEAKRKFLYYIILTSLLSYKEAKHWIEENRLTVEEA